MKIINNIKRAEFNDLLQVLKDIVDYERKVNGCLLRIQPKSMGIVFDENLVNQEFTIEELRDLIDNLLVVFHCNGQQMSKKIKNIKVNRFTLPKFKFSKIEPVF